jgi:hypothetical protein
MSFLHTKLETVTHTRMYFVYFYIIAQINNGGNNN